MKQLVYGMAHACGLVVLASGMAVAQDAVFVESKTVYGGDDICSVGVFLSNSTPIRGLVVPLEIRTETHGAYAASGFLPGGFSWEMVPGNRLWSSPLGAPGPNWPASSMAKNVYRDTAQFVQPCSGPISKSYGVTASAPDFISPDAIMLITISTGDPNIGEEITLSPGADPVGAANASLLIVTGIAPQYGRFVIDTCCATNTHLFYQDEAENYFTPGFTAGVITVRCHHADPSCDGVHSILDVVSVADRAYRGAAPKNDPSCPAHGVTVDGLTDVNCDGVTNVVDHVNMVNVAFRGGDPATLFCNPCP